MTVSSLLIGLLAFKTYNKARSVVEPDMKAGGIELAFRTQSPVTELAWKDYKEER